LSATLPTFVDFFAGSGLVTQGVHHACIPVWSNDICPKKAASYTRNHGDDHFHLGSIEQVSGAAIPHADIVWASFPCQDLSLAGKMSKGSVPTNKHSPSNFAQCSRPSHPPSKGSVEVERVSPD
jgi:site-specific DNA-cytosine methylase